MRLSNAAFLLFKVVSIWDAKSARRPKERRGEVQMMGNVAQTASWCYDELMPASLRRTLSDRVVERGLTLSLVRL